MKVSHFAAAAVVAAATFAALPAAAQTTFYGNVGYTAVDSDEVTLGALGGRIGAQFTPYLGVEGEAAFGVKDDSFTVAGVNVKTELKHSVAVYGVGFLPVNDQFQLLARIGYGSSKLEASGAGVSADDSEESWNFGVGAQYLFDGVNGIRGDYTRHDFRDDGGEADAWTISYVRKF